jgi:DivIVA domain-containing protein
MPLTPSDVSNKLFGRQVRGYSLDEVDAFLDEVESELTRLLTANASLTARLAAAPAAAAPLPVSPVADAPVAPVAPVAPPAPVPVADSQEAALRTLLMAQRTADQAIAEARAEADQLLGDSRTEAERLLSESRDRSARVEQEVNARTASALAELEGRRTELEARIEDLRAFEREYRLRLKAYLESQLSDLDGRGGGAPESGGAGVPAASRTAAVGVMPSGVTDSAAARPAFTPAPTVEAPAPAAFPAAAPLAAPAATPPAPVTASPASASVVDGFPEVLPPEWAELNAPDLPSSLSGLPQLAPEPVREAPSGPPQEMPLPPTPPSLRAVPPLTMAPEPMGPFTVVPPPVQLEQVDDGPEPPSQS